MAVAETTRFPPSEVLEVIFGNLEKSDLLNSRLVCADWNQDCLDFFKKPSSKFRITLSGRKQLDGYIQFVLSSSLLRKPNNNQKQKLQPWRRPVPVMPIHLQTTIIPDRRARAGSDSSTSSDKKFDYEEFRITVANLQNICGSECIRDLNLSFFYPINVHEDEVFEKLVTICRELSPGLEKLEIGLPDLDTSRSHFPEEEAQAQVFPKLKHLSIEWLIGNTPWCTGTNIAWKLIQGCPNLETLSLGKIYAKDTRLWPEKLPFPPGGLKSLKFDHFPTDWLLKKMKEHPSLPALQKLEISSGKFRIIGKEWTNDPNMKQVETCREILRLFAPSLRSLSMPLATPKIGYSSEIEYVPFPDFPVLKNLTIQDLDAAELLDCDFDTFEIDPRGFPGPLESMSIPFDMNLNSDEYEPNISFPTVKSLEYLLFRNYEEMNEQQLGWKKAGIWRDFLHFEILFPNVSTLKFRNNNASHGLKFGPLVKLHLNKFMGSPYRSARKVKTLELINFDQNYLGILLNQIRHPPRFILENMGGTNPLLETDQELAKTFEMLTNNTLGSKVKIQEENRERQTIVELELDNSPFQNYLINVEKIRLVLTKEARANFDVELEHLRIENGGRTNFPIDQQSVDEPKKLYLDEMVASFPHLEEIEVSSVMFARDAGAEGREEIMQRIAEKFPGLKINII